MSGKKRHFIALGVGWAMAFVLKVVLVAAVTGQTVFPIAHIIPMHAAASFSGDGRLSGIELLHLSTWAFAAVTIPAMYWVLNQLGQQRDRRE